MHKKVLVLNGSPRKNGNTSALIRSFIDGTKNNTGDVEEIFLHQSDLNYCTGCLRCNILKRCSVTSDDWKEISHKDETRVDGDHLDYPDPASIPAIVPTGRCA